MWSSFLEKLKKKKNKNYIEHNFIHISILFFLSHLNYSITLGF